MMPARKSLARPFLCVLILATLGLSQSWVQQAPTTSPSARRAGAAVFDANLGKVFMYGGLTTGPTASNNQIWTYDGTTWASVTPATPAPNRWGHRMVYDVRRNKVVTFGGRSPTVTIDSNDTWEWDGVNWTQKFPTASPSPRSFYGMAYDERRGKTVIYGGFSPLNGNQIWEYDGLTWTQVTTPTTIASRETPAMAYDRGRGVIVLFGGYNSLSPGTMYGDTVEYDGTNWRTVVTANSPSPRFRAACDYDTSRNRVVLYGGSAGATVFTDTWEFDGTNWTQVASTGPTKSSDSMMAFHPVLRQHIHFGGNAPSGTSAETWAYSGAYTAIFNTFGKGCIGSGGTPTLQAATLPILGQGFSMNILNLPPTATLTTLVIGFDNHYSTVGNLPFDLSPIGLTGCQLEVALDLILPLPVSGGFANFSIFLPLDPLLAGVTFYAQTYTDDPLCPNGIGTTSLAGRGVMGY